MAGRAGGKARGAGPAGWGAVLTLLAGLLVPLVAAAPAVAADTALSAPQPSWDEPRRIILQLTEDDPARVNGILNNAANLIKFYGQDTVRVAVVTYGAGLRALLAAESPVADRIASLQQYEVEFVACGNTLAAFGRPESDLLPGMTVVTAGIAEIVERTLAGWHYIVP
ncbi:DsrE family protein [Novispirillum sp. DQ9]|uniref:DsrE family protein n=1 Tax=Novispirillum sp. DQ9 TaxID=3398612 RepID=UPI003C7C486F